MDILAAYPEQIEWHSLSSNSHSRAMEMLAANIEMVDWWEFSANTTGNPAAIEVLAAHPADKIVWLRFKLSSNPQGHCSDNPSSRLLFRSALYLLSNQKAARALQAKHSDRYVRVYSNIPMNSKASVTNKCRILGEFEGLRA
jgi:hypothetical protein